MSVKIRLSRIGKKHVPFYRIVAIDSRRPRDGECLDVLGTYDGLKSKLVNFKEELWNKWVGFGAQPSDAAKKLYKLYKKPAEPTEKIVAKPARKSAKVTESTSSEN